MLTELPSVCSLRTVTTKLQPFFFTVFTKTAEQNILPLKGGNRCARLDTSDAPRPTGEAPQYSSSQGSYRATQQSPASTPLSPRPAGLNTQTIRGTMSSIPPWLADHLALASFMAVTLLTPEGPRKESEP